MLVFLRSAVADRACLYFAAAFKTFHKANPFPAISNPSFAGIRASGFVAEHPVNHRGLTLVTAHSVASVEWIFTSSLPPPKSKPRDALSGLIPSLRATYRPEYMSLEFFAVLVEASYR